MHAIVEIHDVVGAHSCAPLQPRATTNRLFRPPRSVGSFIAGFKSAATKRVNAHRTAPGLEVWQRNYYEHIIRDDAELARIRQYILDNPAQWDADPENPVVAKTTSTL